MRAHELARSLGDAARLLEGGDAGGAAAALALAARTCEEAEAAGDRLGSAELAALQLLQARCEAAVRPMREELARALGSAGCARRATTAYGNP
ncbi:MAG TPA: hypothetical protein VEM76_04750 [Anaeromyxobacteraceae bacterium]|nr:hypothetical protein [Anaeromyxobacteraceae bacterium]